MKKQDLTLILAILIIALGGILGLSLYRAVSKPGGPYVRVTVGGQEYGVYYLSEDQTISINGTNVLEIKDGKASMIEAQCPDHICMQMGPVTQDLEMIVCLPNQVLVEGFSGE